MTLNQYIVGDSIEKLKEIPSGIVQCCVTSPPYWGLRTYSVDGQYGLEETPELYIAKVVEAFREVRRVLRDDGTVLLNLGDSYWGGKGKSGQAWSTEHTDRETLQKLYHQISGMGETRPSDMNHPIYKPKDLCMIPHRVALALQVDGWWIRQDIVWAKPNPMPESCTDRPTRAHEYVFLMTKSGSPKYWTSKFRNVSGVRNQPKPDRYYVHKETELWLPWHPVNRGLFKKNMTNSWHGHDYFYDADAVREPHQYLEQEMKRSNFNDIVDYNEKGDAKGAGVGKRRVGRSRAEDFNPAGRNLRSVWTIPTHPFPEAHFACVDEDTECLTQAGWKNFRKLELGEPVAQYDVESGLLSWGGLDVISYYPVRNQDMICVNHMNMEMLLTPNHRTIISRRSSNDRQWQNEIVIRADKLKGGHGIPVSAKWEDDNRTSLWAGYNFAELLGWYIAEGYECKGKWRVDIYQSNSANPEKTKRIKYLLDCVDAEYQEVTAERFYNGEKYEFTSFRIEGHIAACLRQEAPNKKLTPDVLLANNDELHALLRGLIGGDGHIRRNGRFSFIQKDKYLADLVQAIGVRIGYSTKITRRSEGTWTVYFTNKKYISLRGTNGVNPKIKTIQYTGTVWCPQTPLGTWVARKNGRMFITGNTFPPDLAKRCILAGTSHKACEVCGAPWERVVEKEGMSSADFMRGKSKERFQSEQGIKQNIRAPREAFNRNIINFGFRPTCTCDQKGTGRCVVLDPFMGSGTVAMVAESLGRDWIGIDLKEEYREMALKRIGQMGLGI